MPKIRCCHKVTVCLDLLSFPCCLLLRSVNIFPALLVYDEMDGIGNLEQYDIDNRTGGVESCSTEGLHVTKEGIWDCSMRGRVSIPACG